LDQDVLRRCFPRAIANGINSNSSSSASIAFSVAVRQRAAQRTIVALLVNFFFVVAIHARTPVFR
jgi:hypothetical protein